MKLVAGSYERFLWGYDVNSRTRELQWRFAYPAHQGPIKCLATSGAVVATGGADDTIRVFDVNAHQDMGALYQHEGAVTCLAFFHSSPHALDARNHPTHLLSGAEDGAICIWDTEAWVHLVTMKAKKGAKAPVQDLSIHTSGLLALSIERNSCMKMWNLTKGRCSFTTKLPQAAELVNFFPQAGESYALALGNVMEIRNAETGSTIHRLQHEKRIFCMAQRQDNMLVTGGEDCIVRAWDTRSGKQAWVMENAHTNRVKGVAILGSHSDSGDESGEVPHLVASASSDGLLNVWDTRMATTCGEDGVSGPVPLMQAETKARLTCLVSSSGGKKTPASKSSPGEGDVVVGKQPSSAEPVHVSDKKKRKTGAHGSEDGEDVKSLSGKKRQKKQAVKKQAAKTSPSQISIITPISNTSGKRSSRDNKSHEGDTGGTPLNHSKHKKPKLSSKKSSSGPSGKSPKSVGSGKSGKKRREERR